MLRFADRLAVLFGFKDDDSGREPAGKLLGVVIIVVASVITALVLDALAPLVGSSTFDLTHALWHGLVLSVLMVIARLIEYHVRRAPDDQRPRSDPSARA